VQSALIDLCYTDCQHQGLAALHTDRPALLDLMADSITEAPMDRFTNIYLNHADAYHEMVVYEDYEGNLLPALRSVCALDGADVVEFGAGTGRVTCLLAPHVKSIRAFDDSQAMLDIAAKNLTRLGLANWSAARGEHAHLPVEDASADITIEGWAFSMYFLREPDCWREAIGSAIDEMERITRPGGTMVLIETLGTNNEEPRYTHDKMEALFTLAEGERGFSRKWIRTDYRFESPAQAEQMMRFFFGDEMGDRVRDRGLNIVPECTGILWKQLSREG
jgi:ubiquinone/menaquinone biosynthesis C-methylase UbiE